ncbi:MAG: T9SS type A sorting domain-containing protein [Flavobacteriales bacterium]|nr:MAG: T9SS type A sorting domain-containing protein [Flavobacteriales bacterium]
MKAQVANRNTQACDGRKGIQHLFCAMLISTLTAPLASGQSEELLVREFATGIIDTVDAFTYDTVPTFYSTDWNTGSMGNVELLSLVPPTTNLWAGAQFNKPTPAADWFDVTTFPARTAGHLFKYVDGVRSNQCSANLVGRRHALVATHCLRSYGTWNIEGEWLADSFSVALAYDEGLEPLGNIVAQKAYIPMRYSNHTGYLDAALLELREPVGDQTGWLGLASTTDDTYFTDKVFHKFSYPGITDPFDTTLHYNGDTMYYRFGYVDPTWSPGELSVPGTESHGVPGESGSSLIYTDNASFLAFATSAWATRDRHQRLSPELLQAYAQVIVDNSTVGLDEHVNAEFRSYAYPNPAHHWVTVVLENMPGQKAKVEIIDAQGRIVSHAVVGGRETTIDVSALESGLYVYRLIADGVMRATGRFVVEGK